MGEEMLANVAEIATETATEAAAKSVAEVAVGEAVKFTWKEGALMVTSAIGTITIIGVSIFLAVKLIKAITKKIKAKKGISVAEAVDEAVEEVNVEGVKVENPEETEN